MNKNIYIINEFPVQNISNYFTIHTFSNELQMNYK